MQCVCLVDELGNRTMRPCLSSAVKVQVCTLLQRYSRNYIYCYFKLKYDNPMLSHQANDLTVSDLRGSKVN